LPNEAGRLRFQRSVKRAAELNNAGSDGIRVRVIGVSKCGGKSVFLAFRLSEGEVIFDSGEHAAHVVIGQLLWLDLDEMGRSSGEAFLDTPRSRTKFADRETELFENEVRTRHA